MIELRPSYLTIDLVLQYVFLHVQFGLYEEAFTYIESVVTENQFRSIASIHGYAGILSFVLWRIETRRNLHQNDEDYFEDDSNLSDLGKLDDFSGDFGSLHFVNAIKYLETSTNIDPTLQIFSYYYYKLLFAKKFYGRAYIILSNFQTNTPENANGYRYLAEFFDGCLKDQSEVENWEDFDMDGDSELLDFTSNLERWAFYTCKWMEADPCADIENFSQLMDYYGSAYLLI
ncbi:hypothetical protein HK098_001445 [Nowakowskiella sp. JEL0407]|nr:hypothetical protein HK098_001445 [Nowakowskiella sp. JEL0407]